MKKENKSWKPLIFNGSDNKRLNALIASGQVWKTFDTMEAQLTDLIKTRNPKQREKTMPVQMIQSEMQKITQGNSLEGYGNWVYYPWSGHMVRLLPLAEFNELRLSRNRYKITDLEQKKLARLCIGIIGLSVGNAIANTIALEGVFGHLKLADFDELELSNMNRIRAGVHDIGIPKTILAARQVFELNPYAEISLFQEGITAENLDNFLTGDHPVNIIVDECDDISLKIRIREKARALGLPVLMETSDRGMLDVERFDLEQDRPVFHGLLGNTQSSDVPLSLSSEEKIKYALPLLGFDTLSCRLGASFLEIEETIATWPQLGSDVTLGGASMCAAIRNLALDRELLSGRKFVDMDAILLKKDQEHKSTTSKELKTIQFEQPTISPSQKNASIPDQIQKIVSMGILAPSGGNCQPWKFYYDAPNLWVVHDYKRSKNLLDVGHYGTYIALGAAIKNMEVAAAKHGLRTEIESFPIVGNSEIVARLKFPLAEQRIPAKTKDLYPFLKLRVTNRKNAPRKLLTTQQEQLLQSVAEEYDCRLQLISDESVLAEMGSILGQGDKIRFLCEELHRELMSEIRWTSKEAQLTGDGIDVATLELTEIQNAGVKLLSRPDIARYLRKLNAGNKLMEISESAIQSASAVGLISVRGERPQDFLKGGYGFEHLWLKTCGLELALQPMTALLSMFKLLDEKVSDIFSRKERESLLDLQLRFNALFPPINQYSRLMVFRLSKASAPEVKSLRLPIDQVLFNGKPKEAISETPIASN